MDDGTRITIEVEAFLRLAKVNNAEKCDELMTANPELVDCIDAGGYSAMHIAAAHGYQSLMTVLLKHKADKELLNYDKNTPLMLCAKSKQPETMNMLLDAGADVNFTNRKGATALSHACVMGHMDLAKQLVKRGAKIDTKPCELGSPLHWAAGSGNIDMCFWLINDLNVPIDIVDTNGGTPLLVAIHSKHSDLVQFLVERGANVNHIVSRDQSTPLHIAAAAGTVEDVKYLLDSGANPEAKDKDGDTPLKVAEETQQKSKITELSKPRKSDEQRKAESLHFKEQGNKVFANGENNKASKFYSRAIALDNTNHVYFSNRSAAYFNTMQYRLAYYDAARCVQLKADWPKGYFRLAASLKALKRTEEALEACKAGLKLDPNFADLKNCLKDLEAAVAASQ